MLRKEHWDAVYRSKSENELSWTQAEPVLSLKLIRRACPSGSVLDVGGGSSLLADRLLDRGYSVSVLDISPTALQRAQQRLGPRAAGIHWIAADILDHPPLPAVDLWHDRAVLHFLTQPHHRAVYLALLAQTLPIGGHAVLGTFALDGPQKCSGLDVQRYSPQTLAAELGPRFTLLASDAEMHLTPWGAPQSFQFSLFARV